MDIRPILSTLRRHKTAAALIVLEIALSCAIICNAVFLISGRLERMHRPSGLAEDQIVRILISGVGKDDNAEAQTAADLASLRGLPGVRAASVTNEIVYHSSSWNSSVNLTEDQKHPTLNATTYLGDPQLLDTMGLNLVAGRRFLPDEFIRFDDLQKPNSKVNVPAVILSRSAAEKLFPGQSAIGKVIYSWGDGPSRVVGVVEHLLRPSEGGGPETAEYSMLLPVKVNYTVGGDYLIRVTDPDRREEVLKAAKQVLLRNSPNRIIEEQSENSQGSATLEQMRDKYYAQDRAMTWLLLSVCIALLVVTSLGIVGLASFWVQQRTKQIGVRRALGATRGQVLRYFQTENFLLATLGIIVGMLGAYGINQLLMSHYELPRLPALYLPIGAVVLWVLGQLSVLGPARRAAAVPPAVATRSV